MIEREARQRLENFGNRTAAFINRGLDRSTFGLGTLLAMGMEAVEDRLLGNDRIGNFAPETRAVRVWEESRSTGR